MLMLLALAFKNYCLRPVAMENLVVRRATSCYVAKSYSYTICKARNKLPQAIKTAVSLQTFKDKLEMCGNDFFDPIPSHSRDRIPIPIVTCKNIPIPYRNNILIPIPIPFLFPDLVFEVSN